MNLGAIVEMYAGGPGSGCNPRAGRCGRESGGAGSRVFYHGTSVRTAKRIVLEGLMPRGKPSRSSEALDLLESFKYAFLTTSRRMATKYGSLGGGRYNWAVVKFAVPSSVHLVRDVAESRSYKSEGSVPKRFVRAVYLYHGEDGAPRTLTGRD